MHPLEPDRRTGSVARLLGAAAGLTYSVVAFMVTVRLVEKRVKRSEGTEKVASFRAKYRIVDTRCRTQRTILANRPSHEEEPCASATSLARLTACESAPVGPVAMAATVMEAAVTRDSMAGI